MKSLNLLLKMRSGEIEKLRLLPDSSKIKNADYILKINQIIIYSEAEMEATYETLPKKLPLENRMKTM